MKCGSSPHLLGQTATICFVVVLKDCIALLNFAVFADPRSYFLREVFVTIFPSFAYSVFVTRTKSSPLPFLEHLVMFWGKRLTH